MKIHDVDRETAEGWIRDVMGDIASWWFCL
jgi:hypothetical protein